jgi:tetrapyrrole methylase family protein/MazG family protein
MTDSPGALFESLLRVVDRLRGPDGCPWDREQTPASLKSCVIEEAYEVVDAIESKAAEAMREELGDLLFQVVLQARLGAETGQFTMSDVLQQLIAKMVRRHPHVFGDASVRDAREALVQWERLKRTEAAGPDHARSALAGVPASLPALMQAHRLQEKASRVGFDWPDAASAWKKVVEEVAETEAAMAAGDRTGLAEELGDLLFSLANVARLSNIDAEDALRAASRKFRRRFAGMEDHLKARSQDPTSVTLDELNRLWDATKSLDRHDPPESRS